MRIAVSTESACDLSKELIEKYDISVIPYHIILDSEEFKDGERSTEEIFAFVDKNKILPKTTAINTYEYENYFTELKKNYDAVIHMCLSSAITSSCANAEMAAKNIDNVYVIDSKSLSSGLGQLTIYARELVEKGLSPVDIATILTERRENLQASFVIEKLDYLYKGGRCNSLQYFGANLLKLRPRIVLKEGKMLSDKKFRGKMDKVIQEYCQSLSEEFNTPDLSRVFITYSTATPEMIAVARSYCEKVGFKEIIETHAGCTVSSHCGANTLGVLYFNDGDKK